MPSKVTIKSNLPQAFSGKITETNLIVPVVPSFMPLAIGFNLETEEGPELDVGKIEAEYDAKIQALQPQLVAELSEALTSALRSSVWSWSDGSRDIYDTGALANSVNITMSGGSVVVRYTAPYADIVHNGGYIFPYGNTSARPIYLPARPWISSVLYGGGPVPQFDFNEFLDRYL